MKDRIMLENRTAAVNGSSQGRAAVAERPLTSRSATTNKPLRRANGNTAAGRRIRDLYRAFIAGVSNPDDACRAQVLAAAELQVLAENARAELLAGQGDIEQIVRLENLANRAVKRLGIKRTEAPAPTIRERLIAEAEAREEPDNADLAEAAQVEPEAVGRS
jgi:hypothetical protein